MAEITQVITPLPDAPDPFVHGVDEYAAVAAAFALAVKNMGPEYNAFRAQANDLVQAMNAVAAGGAVSLQYKFSTTTTDADPGAGNLRLNSATQNAATVIRADLLGRDTSDYSGVLALLDDSTSATKGYITLRHVSEPTKWLVFAVTALASPSGYKNIAVTPAASSAANPFANGDEILFDFTPTGDKGRPPGWAYTYSSTTTAADPGAGVLRLNHATHSSATALYISETDADGNGIAAVIATWDDSTSTNKAQLKIYKTTDPAIFRLYNVIGTNTDGGAWDTVNLSYIAGNGVLANSDAVTIEVAITGLKGDTGSLSGGNLTGALNELRATVASAASANIWGAAGNQINWTGSVTATGFAAAPQAGARRRLICAAACAFTAGANMLIAGVASGQNLTCAANDIVEVEAITTTQFRLTRHKYDGTAQVASSDLKWLASYSPSGVAAVDIAFTGSYDVYILRIINLIPATDSVSASIAFSTDGGSTFNCDIEHQIITADATTLAGARSNGVAHQFSDSNVSNVTARGGVSAKFEISKPLSTTAATRAEYNSGSITPTPQLRTRQGWLNNDYGSTEDWTHLRISFSSGNIASGTIILYGVSTS